MVVQFIIHVSGKTVIFQNLVYLFIYQMKEIPSTSSTFKLIFDIFEKMLINHKMFINACGLLQ